MHLGVIGHKDGEKARLQPVAVKVLPLPIRIHAIRPRVMGCAGSPNVRHMSPKEIPATVSVNSRPRSERGIPTIRDQNSR
jgi:hypothetical protein